MIMGMTAFTAFHVALSLIGIASGFVVVYGLLIANPMKNWTAIFLVTTVATTVTGFLFPFQGFTPAIGVGILSSAVLAAVIAARYVFHLAGLWRPIYVAGSIVALYFNCFVLVVQSFLKIPALHALAPQGTEPPFAIAQVAVLLAAAVAGTYALRRFNPPPTTV